MLQTINFIKLKFFDFILYKFFFLLILEQFLKKNFKIYICKYYSFLLKNRSYRNKYNLYYLHTLTIFWLKLAFRGKGYRMRKFKKISKITFNFGRSHWTRLKYNCTSYYIRKYRRQKMLCFARFYKDLHQIIKLINLVKPLNFYTKRGLRWKKQYVLRRFGKISQVSSLLH